MTDAELFYQGFEWSSPVSSASKWLVGFTGRLGVSFMEYLAQPGIRARARERLNEKNLWVFCLVLAAWIVALRWPNPVTGALNLILAGLGVVELYQRGEKAFAGLKRWWSQVYYAASEEELKGAGAALSEVLDESLYTFIEIFIGSRAFRLTEALVLKKFPVPEGFAARWRRLLGEEESGAKTAERAPAAPKAAEALGRASGLQMLGGDEAAKLKDQFPTWPVVGGAAALMGAAGLVALAARSRS